MPWKSPKPVTDPRKQEASRSFSLSHRSAHCYRTFLLQRLIRRYKDIRRSSFVKRIPPISFEFRVSRFKFEQGVSRNSKLEISNLKPLPG